MQTYKPKALIKGSQVPELHPDKFYIAIPDKFSGKQIRVEYSGTQMTVKDWRDALVFKRFRDKYYTATNGRKQYYTLGYFKYVPDPIEPLKKV